MKDDTLDKVKAARKAFHAYEKAVQAVIAAGPVRRLGTTVMTRPQSFHGSYYTCAECGQRGAAQGWKFCAYCGCEIVRFADEPAQRTIMLEVTNVTREYKLPSYAKGTEIITVEKKR
jgi:hypothetical protein